MHGLLGHERSRVVPWVAAAVVLAALGGGLVAEEPAMAGAPVAVGLLAGWVVLCRRRPALAFTLVVGLVVFSSHALALAHNVGVPASLIKYAILAKDILCWILFAALAVRLVRERRDAGPLLLVVLFVAICGTFLVLVGSPAPPIVQIQAMRGVLIPMLAMGTVALLRPGERRRVSVLSVYMIAIAAAYALCELLLPESYLTDVIAVGRYWSDVKEQPLFLDPLTGLPGNFFTTDGFPRLSGTFGDPLSAGECLGAGLILAVAYRSVLRRPLLVLVVISAALLLTFTRNGWLLATIGLSVFAVLRYGAGRTLLGAAPIVAGAIFAAQQIPPLQAYVTGIVGGSDASTQNHQAALENSFNLTFYPAGTGWGTGGASALQTFSAAVTSENTYVVILTQVGWIGFILLAIPFTLLGLLVVRRQPFAAVGIAVLLAQAVTGLVSENLLTFNAGFLPFALVGLVAVAPSPAARGPGRSTTGSSLRPVAATGQDASRVPESGPALPTPQS